MPLKASWAYCFSNRRSLNAIRKAFNKAGPWNWEARDSHWYGIYLNTRPARGVRVRIHKHAGEYRALAQIEPDSDASRTEIDGILTTLLKTIRTRNLTPIESYD